MLNRVISTRSIRTPEKARAPPRKLGLGRGEGGENLALVVYHTNNPVFFSSKQEEIFDVLLQIPVNRSSCILDNLIRITQRSRENACR